MNLVCWTDQLSDPQARLLEAVLLAHERSAWRENPSTVALRLAFDASESYSQSIAAALSTLGRKHGPIEMTYNLLANPQPARLAADFLAARIKVPGWATSFTNDVIWQNVSELLASDFSALAKTLDAVTEMLHSKGVMIRPNPSAYTAASAIALGIPGPCSPWLFVQGRLGAWTSMLSNGERNQ